MWGYLWQVKLVLNLHVHCSTVHCFHKRGPLPLPTYFRNSKVSLLPTGKTFDFSAWIFLSTWVHFRWTGWTFRGCLLFHVPCVFVGVLAGTCYIGLTTTENLCSWPALFRFWTWNLFSFWWKMTVVVLARWKVFCDTGSSTNSFDGLRKIKIII